MALTKEEKQARLTELQSQLEEALQECKTLDSKVNEAVEERGRLTSEIKELEGRIKEVNEW